MNGNCLYFVETFATSPHIYRFTDPMQSNPLTYHVSLRKETNGTFSTQNRYSKGENLVKIGTQNVKICCSEAPEKLQSTL